MPRDIKPNDASTIEGPEENHEYFTFNDNVQRLTNYLFNTVAY